VCREALILKQRNLLWGSGTAEHSALLNAVLCAVPIPSLAHHGHATVLSSAFRSAVRFACLLTGNRFGGYRFNAFRRAAAYHSENGPFARNGFSLARNGSRFRGLHSGVKGPSLLLRYLVNWFRCPFGQSAPLPELVCPNSRRFHASGPLHFRPQTHPAALPISTPLREFSLPRDQSVQWASPPVGPPSESARSPLAPRSRFYF
jgi:hypothetical protein